MQSFTNPRKLNNTTLLLIFLTFLSNSLFQIATPQTTSNTTNPSSECPAITVRIKKICVPCVFLFPNCNSCNTTACLGCRWNSEFTSTSSNSTSPTVDSESNNSRSNQCVSCSEKYSDCKNCFSKTDTEELGVCNMCPQVMTYDAETNSCLECKRLFSQCTECSRDSCNKCDDTYIYSAESKACVCEDGYYQEVTGECSSIGMIFVSTITFLCGFAMVIYFVYKLVMYCIRKRNVNNRIEQVRFEACAFFQNSKKASKKNMVHPLVCSFCSLDLSKFFPIRKKNSSSSINNNSKSSRAQLKNPEEILIVDEIAIQQDISNHNGDNLKSLQKQEGKGCDGRAVINKERNEFGTDTVLHNNMISRNQDDQRGEDRLKTVKRDSISEVREEEINKVNKVNSISRYNTPSNKIETPPQKEEVKEKEIEDESNTIKASNNEGRAPKESQERSKSSNQIQEEENNIENKHYQELYCGGFICNQCTPQFEINLSKGIYNPCSVCEEYVLGYNDLEEVPELNNSKIINLNESQRSSININKLRKNNSEVLEVRDPVLDNFSHIKERKNSMKKMHSFTTKNKEKNSKSLFEGLKRQPEIKKIYSGIDNCSICLYSNPSCILPCENKPFHKVHKACFSMLLEKDLNLCPVCRTTLFQKTVAS